MPEEGARKIKKRNPERASMVAAADGARGEEPANFFNSSTRAAGGTKFGTGATRGESKGRDI